MAYSYMMATPDRLSATDLIREMARQQADGVDCEIALAHIDGDQSESAQVLFFPAIGRGGVAWGADALWTDAHSVEDVLDRFTGAGGKGMCE